MKKNRYLPFGYHIQNGALCINEAEAAIVQQTFADYQSGMSYRLIAEKRTAERVPYLEKRTDWNKHMVKRMFFITKNITALFRSVYMKFSLPTFFSNIF